MREIPLSQGYVAVVDDQDYERIVAEGRWWVNRMRNGLYAVRKTSGNAGAKRVTVQMHRFIMGAPWVDHINGDGLDNRRSNLRLATHQENNWNRKVNDSSGTGFKGVTRVNSRTRYVARIKRDGRQFSLGSFSTAEEAAGAYDRAARELHGEFAWLNFPTRQGDPS